jgi:hypothetical protein
MSEGFERMITYGARPVSYPARETWTDEVKALYARLKDGDSTALAPLLEWNIEFIRAPMATAALICLKYTSELPARQARAELRRIANVIIRRPARRKTKLPYGDRLLDELQNLTAWIETHELLKLRKNAASLRERVDELLEPPRPVIPPEDCWPQVDGKPVYVPPREMDVIPMPPAVRAKITDAIVEAVQRPGGMHVRKPRAWALQALALYYDVEPKDIEKCISRDLKSGRRKRST